MVSPSVAVKHTAATTKFGPTAQCSAMRQLLLFTEAGVDERDLGEPDFVGLGSRPCENPVRRWRKARDRHCLCLNGTLSDIFAHRRLESILDHPRSILRSPG
jgi:hypothetical protein